MKQSLRQRPNALKGAGFDIFGDYPYDLAPKVAASDAVARIVADVMKPKRRKFKVTLDA